jgi:hypothetical protein
MEKDMINISQRKSTKDEVLRVNAELYRKLFLQVMNESDKLDQVRAASITGWFDACLDPNNVLQACAKYFDPLGTSFTNEKKNFSTCGKCSGQMSLRAMERVSAHLPTFLAPLSQR